MGAKRSEALLRESEAAAEGPENTKADSQTDSADTTTSDTKMGKTADNNQGSPGAKSSDDISDDQPPAKRARMDSPKASQASQDVIELDDTSSSELEMIISWHRAKASSN
jgi:hypothetical protein